MTLHSTKPFTSFASLSAATIALIIAIISSYLALDRKVTALAATAVSQVQVEHLIDLKTSDKLDEILRWLQVLDARIDRLQIGQQGDRVKAKGQEP